MVCADVQQLLPAELRTALPLDQLATGTLGGEAGEGALVGIGPFRELIDSDDGVWSSKAREHDRRIQSTGQQEQGALVAGFPSLHASADCCAEFRDCLAGILNGFEHATCAGLHLKDLVLVRWRRSPGIHRAGVA